MDLHQETNTSELCANGCGFYGSKATKNLCSKCFNEDMCKRLVLEEEKAINNHPFTRKNVDVDVDVDDPKKNEKVMCMCCKKKIRELMIFECRCGGKFCKKHRYPEEHSCTFDFKNLGRLLIAMDNLVVKADKLDHRV